MEIYQIQLLKPFSFVMIFSICLIWEITGQNFQHSYKKRFIQHFLLLFLGGLTVTLFTPSFFKTLFETSFFSYSLKDLEFFPGLILTIIIFDVAIYWQHRFSHTIPFLWRFHTVHHCDDHMDLTTGFRFHPGEIYLSSLYKTLLIALFGPSIEQYIIYETILFSMALFNHSNGSMPARLDKFLRLLIVTPQMHYPHHHPDKENTNSNYGNFLSIWDRIFGTYNSTKTDQFGIDFFDGRKTQKFSYLLKYPFISSKRLDPNRNSETQP